MKHFICALALGLLPASAFAQVTLNLSYPAGAPGATPCIYTTDADGLSSLRNGNLSAIGSFSTGCPSGGGGTTLPLPVIVPGPENWSLPAPWSVGQGSIQQWAAVNATTCTYAGSSATGWPSGQTACTGSACQTLKTVTITPPSPGTYTFSLVCTNATGSDTSVSPTRTVAGNAAPVITAGPGLWGTLQPWTTADTKSVAWAANDATSCSLTATSLPSGVTLNTFLGGGASSCSGTTGCATSHPLTLTTPVAGTYGLNLSCTNAVGTVTSSNNWTVTTGGGTNPTGCLSPAPGWNRMLRGTVYYNNNNLNIGEQDVTTFESVWGRNYPSSGGSGTGQIQYTWPGFSAGLATVDFANNQFLALKFRTPAGTAVRTSQLTIDSTTFSLTGGGSTVNGAKQSMTVSRQCGDFNTASTFIPAGCFKSQMGGNSSFSMLTNATAVQACTLQPDTEYYLNIIYAPLTSPASAVFNGRGDYVVQIRNFSS